MYQMDVCGRSLIYLTCFLSISGTTTLILSRGTQTNLTWSVSGHHYSPLPRWTLKYKQCGGPRFQQVNRQAQQLALCRQCLLSWWRMKQDKMRRKPGSSHRSTTILSEPVLLRSGQPFAYWQVNKGRFPAFAQTARAYLCSPCTSVDSEGLFSTAAHIIDDKRK